MILEKRKSALLTIFLTIFIDLVGFGIIIPLSPFLAKHYGATELEVGMLQASYSLAQFVFAPFWGRMSDIYGRRPIILISVLGAGLSYVFFAFSSHLWMLFLARSLAGFFGGNISAASAYIADITPHESRSKNMGLIGAAFGLGFIVGPVLGGILGHIGPTISELPPFGLGFPALGAAILCAINFGFAFFSLQESRTHKGEVAARADRLQVFLKNIRKPAIGRLMITFFFSGLAMAHMESMLFIYVKDVFGWGMQTASFGFAFVGVIMVFTQGYLIRKLIPKYGERRLLIIGLVLAGIGIFGIGLSETLLPMALLNISLALGIGMSNPSTLGSISLLSDKQEQGSTMGVTQSLSALGRILGPVSGGFLYQTFGRSTPFFAGGSMMALGLLNLLPVLKQLPQTGKSGSGSGGGH